MQYDRYVNRTYQKFDRMIEAYAGHIFKKLTKIDELSAYPTMEHLRLPPDPALMQPIAAGDTWGEKWGNLWLHADVTVPEECAGETFCVIPDANAVEILCFKNGVPAGIINSKNNFLGGQHSAMFVAQHAVAGESFALDFECYAGHEGENFTNRFDGLWLCVLDRAICGMVFDLSTVLQMARLPADDFLAKTANECLMNAFPYLVEEIDYADMADVYASVEPIRAALAPALAKSDDHDPTRGFVGVIGHSHMDTAWLWPVAETVRKCARTYSEVLTLMDIYPEYTFIQSSALHLDWMRREYPAIFEGIQKRVAEGRYEPNGGVWVECDCNITGGESMVRQFLYGQRFTRKYFGYTSDTFWLPDTFGYNAAIPQIMQGCGVKYFYTTKMGWSDLNPFPADTFVWRGMDGSEVITHLNIMHCLPDVQNVKRAINEIRDKRSSSNKLLAYGFGDGGGGPTYAMLEYLRRERDVAGLPEIEPVTISGFMHRLEKSRDTLPLHDGELYLEFHRGTLTSMHDIKRNNRRAEEAMHDLEWANVLSGKARCEETDGLYEVLLKNQFHDILPGTSIECVNVLARKEVGEIIARAKAIAGEYLDTLTEGTDNTITAANSLSFDRNEVVTLTGKTGVIGHNTQSYTAIDGTAKTDVEAAIPAFGSTVLSLTAAECTAPSPFAAGDHTLETPYYSVIFDEDGYISSLIDKRVDRQVRNLHGAPLGTLWLGEDVPTTYDNWEIEDDIFRRLKPVTGKMTRRETVSEGAVEYRIRATYNLGKKSAIVIDTVFYAHSPRIDFVSRVDWDERHTLLKVGFDVDVRAFTVKNEIQFGYMERPTTRNTSLEAAKFEVCNHRYSDLSESRYGVAVLNDCKYGISVEGGDMRLTLHKGGCHPDPTNDRGVHDMTWSLLPHTGAFSAENVVREAHAMNHPPLLHAGKAEVAPICRVDESNILCDTVKMAEDVENAFVLRLYECERNRTTAHITIPTACRVWRTNMLEEKIEELPMTADHTVEVSFHPFAIETLLCERK